MRYCGRGRPRKNRPIIDLGTRELQEKRKHNLTSEPLDVCLKRGLINPNQHWAALHFRWLHTLRYGVVNLRAIDPGNLGGIERKIENIGWSQAKESEYLYAREQLQRRRLTQTILDVCIYNEWPRLLKYKSRKSFSLKDEKELKQLKTALNILINCWDKHEPRKFFPSRTDMGLRPKRVGKNFLRSV